MTTAWLLVAALAMAVAAPAHAARTLSVSADRLRAEQVDADGLRFVLVERLPDSTLRIEAARLSVPGLAVAGRIDWRCTLERDASGMSQCAGSLRFTPPSGVEEIADVSARLRTNELELAFARDGASASVVVPLSTPAAPHVALRSVPANWLRSAVANAWKGGELRSGVFDIDATRDREDRVAVEYRARELAFNTFDGTFSGTDLDAAGTVVWAPGPDGAAHLAADTALTGGSLRAGALRIALPPTPVQAQLDATLAAGGRWDVSRFAWHDADALIFEADGSLEPAQLAPLERLAVRIQSARFPLLLDRYAPGLPAAYGFAGAKIDGEVAGEIALDRAGLQRMMLSTDRLDATAAGVSVVALRGGIDWVAAGERPPRAIAWKAARFDGFALPALATRWQARSGALHLLGEAKLALFGGTLRLRNTVLDPRAQAGDRASTAFAISGLSYDSADGSVGIAGFAANGTATFAGSTAQPHLRLDARLHGGQLLAGPVYVQLPRDEVTTSLDAHAAEGAWHVDSLDWNDAGALSFHASAQILPSAERPLRRLSLELRDADVATLISRYAQSWLAAKGYPTLAGHGRLSGSVNLDENGLQAFAFSAHSVDVRDGAGRFAFTGVDGGVDWRYGVDGADSTLDWQAIELLHIPFGSARARIRSGAETIALAEPLEADLLGGKLRLEKFGMQPRSPRGERYAGSFAIVGLDMPQVSAAFGWPKFPGSLSGGVPEMEFVGDVVELHGGLDLYVFDGHLGLSGLRLERPFGVAPSLGADIHFENFDLEQFTSAFSIGGMTGRLDGTIGGLRLVDWSPVAFDAWLRTKGGGRLSYKAVSDLTSIGGGGFSDNLQTIALKVFDTFGYRRLGLRCALAEGICAMAGVDAQAPLAAGEPDPPQAGYTIVEGSGVPRLDIIGHRRRVDWPTLSQRIGEAMQGRAPVIE